MDDTPKFVHRFFHGIRLSCLLRGRPIPRFICLGSSWELRGCSDGARKGLWDPRGPLEGSESPTGVPIGPLGDPRELLRARRGVLTESWVLRRCFGRDFGGSERVLRMIGSSDEAPIVLLGALEEIDLARPRAVLREGAWKLRGGSSVGCSDGVRKEPLAAPWGSPKEVREGAWAVRGCSERDLGISQGDLEAS